MEAIGVRELRQNASKYLKRVAAGESITITDRGTPMAVLAPPVERTMSVRDQLITAGELTPAIRDGLRAILGLPAGQPTVEEPVSEELAVEPEETEE
jgi:prevent-host-death family protein